MDRSDDPRVVGRPGRDGPEPALPLQRLRDGPLVEPAAVGEALQRDTRTGPSGAYSTPIRLRKQPHMAFV